jgi:hypothetical protein
VGETAPTAATTTRPTPTAAKDSDAEEGNPARRRIPNEAEVPMDIEVQQRRFHAIALDAKMRHREFFFVLDYFSWGLRRVCVCALRVCVSG